MPGISVLEWLPEMERDTSLLPSPAWVLCCLRALLPFCGWQRWASQGPLHGLKTEWQRPSPQHLYFQFPQACHSHGTIQNLLPAGSCVYWGHISATRETPNYHPLLVMGMGRLPPGDKPGPHINPSPSSLAQSGWTPFICAGHRVDVYSLVEDPEGESKPLGDISLAPCWSILSSSLVNLS